jgi:magnesium chelatase subunit D
VDVTDRVALILACSAVDERLAGLLFLGLDSSLVYPLGDWLADLLGDASDGRPPVIPIGSQMTEENLWERFRLDNAGRSTALGLRWEPGPLARRGRPPAIVVVSDLAIAGLPASRAAVALLDSEVAHLERSGVSLHWTPRDRWLVALRRADAGRISAHLLDRFAVRVSAEALKLPRYGGPVLNPPEPAWRRVVQAVRGGAELPALSVAAADEVVEQIPRAPGARRDLALARLARALAALQGEPEVVAGHVEQAAELAGLPAPLRPRRSRRARLDAGADAPYRDVPAGPVQVNAPTGRLAAVPGDEPVELPPEVPGSGPAWTELPLTHAYPEDSAKSQRDVTPLRLGWQQALTGPPRGAPIGTQRTLEKRDIAVTATLLNAARYQRLRCPAHYSAGHRLHVIPPDLLSYRRAPRQGHLLVLLLDHTCRRRDWDWYRPLAPYLRWAYVHRALVGVVEMGAGGASDPRRELRASQFRSRGVLDPKVAKALERDPGRTATPLAHGLTLAAAMLRRDTQQVGALVSDAFLVVITDGRANVPLSASHSAVPPATAVGPAAIADAEAAAHKISMLRRVRSTLIYPGPMANGQYAASLAAALGAPLVPGTPPTAGPPRLPDMTSYRGGTA